MNGKYFYGQQTRVKCTVCNAKMEIIPDAGTDIDLADDAARVPVGCPMEHEKTTCSSSQVILNRGFA